MLLTTAVQGAHKQTLADVVPELLNHLKGLETYVYSSLILFIAAIVLGFLILIRGCGIGYRLALLPLALLPFLICLTGAIWKISTYPYSQHAAADPFTRSILHEIARILVLVPFGVLQSFLLLLLSFFIFIQAGNSQLAYVLPGRSTHTA